MKVTSRLPSVMLASCVMVLCAATSSLSVCQGEDHKENAMVLNDNDGRDYNPYINPADFVKAIDNPFLTLTPGQTWTYEGTEEDGKAVRSQLEVTQIPKSFLA